MLKHKVKRFLLSRNQYDEQEMGSRAVTRLIKRKVINRHADQHAWTKNNSGDSDSTPSSSQPSLLAKMKLNISPMTLYESQTIGYTTTCEHIILCYVKVTKYNKKKLTRDECLFALCFCSAPFISWDCILFMNGNITTYYCVLITRANWRRSGAVLLSHSYNY